MTVTVDVLRDRVEDILADMERQMTSLTPTLEPLIDEILAGDRAAFGQLQAVGRSVLAPLIDTYGNATGALAAGWYDLNRDLLQIEGSWSGATLQDPNVDTGPLVGGVVTDFVSTQSVLSGLISGMETRVRQAGNGTIMDSVLRDKQALGWGRVASLGCCGFCALLAARGAVYRTRFTATFCPHDHCQCQAVPMWKSNATLEGLRSREDTIATRRAMSDKQRAAQNAQASSWIADHRDTLGLL